MFTLKTLTEAEITPPPVLGCACTYCTCMLTRGFAVRGHGSLPSHRLKGGNEQHNPENKARLALKALVPEESFNEYVSMPGGCIMGFKGPSGLWYEAGRTHRVAGHYVIAYQKKGGPLAAWLCLPPTDYNVPLASIVAMHYLALTTNEKNSWRAAALSNVSKDYIPAEIRAGISRRLYE